MRIGVLAVQGAFAEHLATLDAIGVKGVAVRLPSDLEDVSGLILPGGESTAQRRLIDRWGLREPILDLARSGAPLFGTCAGMILLARETSDGDPTTFELLDVAVRRNAFGRQLDSFETDLHVPVLGDQPVHAVFIRAPVIERTGPGVDVLARLDDGRIVDRQFYGEIRDQELTRLGGPGVGRLAEAAGLLDRLVLDDEFAEFLTLRAYPLLD